MIRSVAIVATEHASRYLQQLCKHWSHKFEITFTPEHGDIVFTEGRHVTLDAAASALTLTLSAPDAEGMDKLEEVVANHIIRFAFREELVFNWQRG